MVKLIKRFFRKKKFKDTVIVMVAGKFMEVEK